jgi:hypothetical protein
VLCYLLQELKRRRTAMQEDLRTKETSTAELQQGLKKVQLAVKLGIRLTDLVEDSMPVPADAIPRIVGKVRLSLDCRVSSFAHRLIPILLRPLAELGQIARPRGAVRSGD